MNGKDLVCLIGMIGIIYGMVTSNWIRGILGIITLVISAISD